MSTLLKKFDESIKKEHKDIYDFLKRNNKIRRYIIIVKSRIKWYHYFGLVFFFFLLNLLFSFDFSAIPILKYLNFIELNTNYVERVLHEYTLYIGTFISITLIATTFLFNFLKEIMDSNIKLIVRYVNYEAAAYYGFSLVICLVLQKFISLTLPIETLKNLLVLDFYFIVIFIFLLLRLYTKVFEIIKPTKLKEMYLNETKKLCSLNIFQELYEIKSKKIYIETLVEKGFIETSNSNYFWGDGPQDNLKYLFNRKKGLYLKNVNFDKLIKRTNKFGIKHFVPVHFGQFFDNSSDYLLFAFEKDNKKFKENKFLKFFNISKGQIIEYFILNSFSYRKKNIDKNIANDELDEKLEFMFDELNDSIYKRNHKGIKNLMNDFDIIIDMYTKNFE